MFPGELYNWDINKVALCHWSMFYDSVYESTDKPPQHVIEDDDLIDKWYENKIEEYERKARETSRNDGSGLSAYNHDDVIVFNYEEEDEIES